jgi:small subunit ribosomal protein S13
MAAAKKEKSKKEEEVKDDASKQEIKEAPAHAKKEKKEAVKEVPKTKKGIVRIAGKDMGGEVKMKNAVFRIRGIGHSLKNAVTSIIHKKLGIEPDFMIGNLSDEQIENVDKLLFSLSDKDFPHFLMNRQGDAYSGEGKHLIMNDLAFALRNDLEFKKKSRTWQGFRASKGKKVRGQRTRNTGRHGLTMGVMREKLKPSVAGEDEGKGKGRKTASAPAAAPAPAEKK